MSNQLYDVIIIGAGVAGLVAARQAIKQQLSYIILEANSPEWLGGRVHTELIDLTQYQQTIDQTIINQSNNNNLLYTLPSSYKFEFGGAWLHGIDGSKTFDLIDELYSKYYPLRDSISLRNQIAPVMEGCGWLLPEYLPSNYITLFDIDTQSTLTPFQHLIYLIVTCFHLRSIFRSFPHLHLDQFLPIYIQWITKILPQYKPFINQIESTTQPFTPSFTTIICHAIHWYFHSIEGYHGVTIDELQAKDVFYPCSKHGYGDEANFDANVDILNTILTNTSQNELFQLLDKWISIGFEHTDIIINNDNIDQLINFTPNNITPMLINEYSSSKYYELDADTHGCYIGDHSTLKCGMNILPKLLVEDIEYLSNTKLNIKYNHLATTISYTNYQPSQFTTNNNDEQQINDNIDDSHNSTIPIKYNTVTTVSHPNNDTDHNSNNNNNCNNNNSDQSNSQHTSFYAKKSIITTGSIRSLCNLLTFDPLPLETNSDSTPTSTSNTNKPVISNDDTRTKINNTTTTVISPINNNNNDIFPTKSIHTVLETLNTTTQSVYYKKVAFCFDYPWWPQWETARFVGLLGHKPIHTDKFIDDKNQNEKNDQTTYIQFFDTIVDLYKDFTPTLTTSIQEQINIPTSIQSEMVVLVQLVQKIIETNNTIPSTNMVFESHIINKQTPVLSASIIGPLAQQLDQYPDYVSQIYVLIHLYQLYHSSNVKQQNNSIHIYQGQMLFQYQFPIPLFSRTTKWSAIPTFGHSYSLVTNWDYDTTNRMTFGARYGVLFAGEGLDVYQTGSIHSAIMSGEKAISLVVQNITEMIDDDDEDCEWAVVDEE